MIKIDTVFVLIGLLALQLAPGVNLVARAQQSGNTDGTGNNATLDITYPPRVMTGPKQLCHSDLHRDGVRSQVNKDIHSILRNKVLPRLCAKGHSETNPAASCNEVFLEGCHSGYYWISANDSSVVQAYCDMNRRCCNTPGGWMRVANLNMADETQHCPDGWRELANPKRLCRRAVGSYVNSVVFNTHRIPYSHVCGSIIGYQFGTPEGFLFYTGNPNGYTVESNYVDGVSVTYGVQGERRHIWTFAGARSERDRGTSICPCTNTANTALIRIPPWVESDYFCETGTTAPQESVFYLTDPLWDGKGCGSTSTCCSYNQPPWFCKQLSETTSENIEVRLLTGANPDYLEQEDTPIQSIELYIQ